MPTDSHTPAPANAPGGMGELLAIAVPMLVSHACESLMMFVDRLFLSKVSPACLNACLGGGLTCFMFMTFFIGLTGYTNALVAQYLGANRKELCAVATSQALLICLIAAPLLIAAIPIGHWLFAATGAPPEQIGLQKQYFAILMCGALFALVRHTLASFFSGLGQTRVVMEAALVAMVVNVSANYILIFGHLGLPALGIVGAALGTLLGSAVGAVWMLNRYLSPTLRQTYGTTLRLRVHRDILAKLCRFGTPAGVEFCLNLMAFNLVVLSFHSYGLLVAAAVTITFSWDLISFIPLVGVGVAVTSLVGRYMGAGDPETAARATHSGVRFAAGWALVTFTAFCLIPEPLVSLFRPADTEAAAFQTVMPLAIFMVRLMAIYVFADAMGIVFGSALRGAGDTFWTMVISVTGHWVMALVTLSLIYVFDAPPRTSWIATVLLVVCLGTTFYLRFRSGRWRTLTVVEPPVPVHDETEAAV